MVKSPTRSVPKSSQAPSSRLAPASPSVEAVNKVGWDGELIVPGATEVEVLYLPITRR